MDNALLLNNLAQRGIIDNDVYAKLNTELGYLDKPVAAVMVERRLADGRAIAEVKGQLLNVPFKAVDSAEISDEVLKLIPGDTALTYKVLPISRTQDMLVVGMVHPDDPKAQDALRFMAKRMATSLGVYIISISDFKAVARRFSPFKSEIEAAVQAIDQVSKGNKEAVPIQRRVSLDAQGNDASEAPIIKIVASTLQEAVEKKASDIHIEPQRARLRIRFRVDGDLAEVASLPLVLHNAVVARVKVLSSLKIDETRVPQDGRFRTVLSGRDIDFRVATFPTPSGEKVVLRILDPTVGLKGLSELGLGDYNVKIMNEALSKPYGMVLVSGPTGSGKTTTLYALLQVLNKGESNIVSLEDPVEYFVEGLNQSQVRPEIGYTFAVGLRQILRQDPDVIMVGEIRDGETAELAVHAALTGHIVLSTIHTNDSIGVVPRLVDMGVQKFLLSSAINVMAAQRLVGRLCDQCKKAVQATGEETEIIKQALAAAPESWKKVYKEPFTVYKPVGCQACNNRGVVGRVALFEIFKMTAELKGLMAEERFSETEVRKEAVRQGMIPMRLDGVVKVLVGQVSLEEVVKETEEWVGRYQAENKKQGEAKMPNV